MKKLIWLLSFIASSIHVWAQSVASRPNILWLTSEDNGQQLGCYGDDYSVSPNLDAFASSGMRFLYTNSNAPVCAPARTTVITGLYAVSTGSDAMRTETKLPKNFKMFPQFLREVGYYCTNNFKEDYNLEKPGKVWDESSRDAHWKNRASGQPFFAVFNYMISHEMNLRNEIEAKDRIHDAAKVRVPPYQPDTPEVRSNWVQYYDRITMMDAECGRALRELEAAGLKEDTIVFYWGDHGAGMPRSKRHCYYSGLQVPLIVYFPEKWKHLAPQGYAAGGSSDRLVSFVDLAPTMLSLVGLKPPAWMQGHAFAGKYISAAPEYTYGFRGRMGERYDFIRSVTNHRYHYIRNYTPYRIYGQYSPYMFKMPATQSWQEQFLTGHLNEVQSSFWQKKQPEELYDLKKDPYEIHNLASLPEFKTVLEEMRQAHQKWAFTVCDLGFLPEAEMRTRSGQEAPYDYGHGKNYDLEALYTAAQTASFMKSSDLPLFVKYLESGDSAIRYWGAVGLLAQEKVGVEFGRKALLQSLDDPAPSVAITAAEALGRFGKPEEVSKALDTLLRYANLSQANLYDALLACNALDYLGERALPRMSEIQGLPTKPLTPAPRAEDCISNLMPYIIANLEKARK